jgi:hypothetical protein
MAKAGRKAKRGVGATIFGLINPIRDPSLLLAIIITIIAEGSAGDPPLKVFITFLLFWMATKAFVWLAVNTVFSSVFLARKAGWMLRNPRLTWRLLDALGTEEIIIGGLRPDMFATEDGRLHEGMLGNAAAAGLAGFYGPGLPPPPAGYGPQPGYGEYGDPAQYGPPDQRSEELHELLATYAHLIADWMGYTEEKWRTVSDSQLGWKPLRGRWNGWDEIYRDSYGVDATDQTGRAAEAAGEAMARRFEYAHDKGSAASAVACFLRDLDTLRQRLAMFDAPDATGVQRVGGIGPQQPITQRTGKAPIIRNPMIVDAD